MKKKIINIVLCAVALVGLLSGCGGDKQVDGTTDKKQIIRMTYSGVEVDGATADMNVVFADFYKDNPNCEVVVEEGGSALMAKIAANDAPDIIRMAPISELPTYVNKNILMPLDDNLAESELYDESDMFQIGLDAFRYDGKEFGKGNIYGLPKDWCPTAVWVNKAMFEAQGLPVPTYDNPMTYDEMYDYASKLTVKDGNKVAVFGLADNTGPAIAIESKLNLEGKSMFSEDFSKIDLSDEAVRAAFKYYYEMKLNGYTQSPLNPMDGNGNPEFPVGKCAINDFGLFAGALFVDNPERTVEFEDMVLTAAPVASKDNRKIVITEITGAGISATTKIPDLAYKCWEYIHLDTPSQLRANLGFNLPARKSFAENAAIENEWQKKNTDETIEFANNVDYVFMRSNPYVTVTAISGVFEKYFTPLLYGQYKFDEALDLIESEIQLLIDEGMAN